MNRNIRVRWASRVGRQGNRHINPLGYLGVSSYYDPKTHVSPSIEVEILPLTEGKGCANELISGQGSILQNNSQDNLVHAPLDLERIVSSRESRVGKN